MTQAERAAQIWQVLVCAAGNSRDLTYGELADLIGTGPEGKGAGTLAQPLGFVMRYCAANGLPPLTVLVVNKATRQPGVGLTTVQETESDREKVLRHKWFFTPPPQISELSKYS